MSGQRYISPQLAGRLAYNLSKSSGDLSTKCLSDREFQVFRMLATGKTVTEIAGELPSAYPAAVVTVKYGAEDHEYPPVSNGYLCQRYPVGLPVKVHHQAGKQSTAFEELAEIKE